ncbi:hypothetical protein [Calothrix sp. PCC 6303]|uniref:hypothetical protein n=1 Tax=Calothrix sp. PCC 6303 TaxID=1170562 RepID=UPI0002A047E9|nr:hypothetical protein [Calothrix sp. PCC 6303]AFZ04241.1 hypothetical protein Cal6303_5358 [Calothrix sp. PCC 6303]
MSKTFKAWLRGSRLEWIDEAPQSGEQMLQIEVTFIDEQAFSEVKTRGQRMAEILENLAATKTLNYVDPVSWQEETRQERSLPGR